MSAIVNAARTRCSVSGVQEMNAVRVATLVNLLALSGASAGCISTRTSLLDPGRISVEIQANERVDILWPDVYRQDDRLWAYGALKQRGYRTQTIRRHVDIAVLGEDGAVQFRTYSKDIPVPPNRVGRGPGWTRFRVELSDVIPDNAKIVMAVHLGEHAEG